jgi:hypothetical protein
MLEYGRRRLDEVLVIAEKLENAATTHINLEPDVLARAAAELRCLRTIVLLFATEVEREHPEVRFTD